MSENNFSLFSFDGETFVTEMRANFDHEGITLVSMSSRNGNYSLHAIGGNDKKVEHFDIEPSRWIADAEYPFACTFIQYYSTVAVDAAIYVFGKY